MIEECICKTDEFYKGYWLFDLNSHDYGYSFHRLEINYCPVCGRALPMEDELDELE